MCIFSFHFSYSDETPLLRSDIMQETHVELIDLGSDPVLGLHDTAETWSQQEMPKDIKQSIKDKSVMLQVQI